MGKSGVGKTTFYNKLCETDHAAAYSSKSLTRQLYRSEVVQGGSRFSCNDTPGTDSNDEVFKHSYLLKEALTNEPLNAIFTLVQFNDRCDSALEEFDKTISYLKEEYYDMVVVVVNKFDMAPQEHSKEIQDDYRKQFKAEGFPRIMFHSPSMSAVDVAAQMLGFMTRMPKKQLHYEEADFLKYFRIADEGRQQKKIVGKLETEVHAILDGYTQLLQALGRIADKDEVIMSAIASSRYEVDQIYDRFTAEYGARMIDLDCYTNAITLQKVIEGAHREFRDRAKGLLSYNPDDSTDWKNCVRKCQFCGEIWVKVSGCDGVTTCGNREDAKDVSSKPFFQYLFERLSNGTFRYRKNEAVATNKAKTDASSRGSIKAKGCGRSINWSDQQRLSAEEIQQCLDVKGIETIIMAMRQQPQFDQAFKSYVQTIDTSFTR